MVRRRGFSVRQDDSSGLIWVLVLTIAAAVLSGWFVASRFEHSGSDSQQRPGFTLFKSWLTGVPATRPRLGFQPSRAAEAAPPILAPEAAAARVEGQLQRVAGAAMAAPGDQPMLPRSEPDTPRGSLPEAGQTALIANTEGVGVVLRSGPRENARMPRGLLEGARVTVLERSGDTWVRVRGENGLEGWIPAQYLRPAR